MPWKISVKSANDEEFTEDLEKVSSSVFGKDFDIPKLKHHLAMLNDIIHLALPTVKKITVKTAFTISVVKDHLVFMTEILCMDNFVQKSFCGERLSAERDQRQPDFASTEPFTCTSTWNMGQQ